MSDTGPIMNHPQFKVRSTAGTWVQTERSAHEAWAALIASQPRAAQLLHLLVANMDARGVLIVTHTTLAKLAGVSVSTIKRATAELVKGCWIQTIRMGSERGGSLAYAVNSRVAWGDKRDNLKFAVFDARVLISSEDQPDLGEGELKQIPSLYPGELQLPSGPGEDPPTQPNLGGLEPDLPALQQIKEVE